VIKGASTSTTATIQLTFTGGGTLTGNEFHISGTGALGGDTGSSITLGVNVPSSSVFGGILNLIGAGTASTMNGSWLTNWSGVSGFGGFSTTGTSITAFSIQPTSGNISGTFALYAYN
jgi:hypothetical protein